MQRLLLPVLQSRRAPTGRSCYSQPSWPAAVMQNLYRPYRPCHMDLTSRVCPQAGPGLTHSNPTPWGQAGLKPAPPAPGCPATTEAAARAVGRGRRGMQRGRWRGTGPRVWRGSTGTAAGRAGSHGTPCAGATRPAGRYRLGALRSGAHGTPPGWPKGMRLAAGCCWRTRWQEGGGHGGGCGLGGAGGCWGPEVPHGWVQGRGQGRVGPQEARKGGGMAV